MVKNFKLFVIGKLNLVGKYYIFNCMVLWCVKIIINVKIVSVMFVLSVIIKVVNMF